MSKRINKFLLLASAGGLLASATAMATDIANSPLITSASDSVLPNIMFILDDSGSMNLDGLPDHIYSGHCKATDGDYDHNCCSDLSGNGAGSSTPCWQDTSSYSSSDPFGADRGHPPFLANEFNTVYYSPGITYTPPRNANGSNRESYDTAAEWGAVPNDAYNIQATHTVNLLTQFPDMEWCTNSNYTDCLRNGNYLLPGSVTVGGSSKSYTTRRNMRGTGTGRIISGSPIDATVTNRTFGPHYYVIEPGEFCDNINLRNCQTTQTSTYNIPAPVRWCSSTANSRALEPVAGSCQGLYSSTYRYARYPGKFGFAGSPFIPGSPYVPPVAAFEEFTISMSNCQNTSNGRKRRLDSLTVSGTNIMSGATADHYAADDMRDDLVNKINAASNNFTATATNAGSSSSASLRITAPATSNVTATLVLNHVRVNGSSSNQCTLTTNPTGNSLRFAGYQAPVAAVPDVPAVPASYPGTFRRVDIVSGQTYPKAATRTDCAGATCSYAEEMTNFANWWAYYHTRMQMMKSSTALAFNPIGDKYRVGFAEINSTNLNRNVTTFDNTTKTNWYASLFGSVPGDSTPLQKALSRAGRIYAGVTGLGTGGADPVQYSCQQNFTILSTDGYWNGPLSDAIKIDGSAINQQDGDLDRPYFDGNSTSNNLADIAAYYYNTDLRTGTTGSTACTKNGVDICGNNVPTSGLDTADHQHMTTFTVGLGIPGLMNYQADYDTASSGDFYNIKNGLPSNAVGGVCSWQSTGACAWPNPDNATEAKIDDLWHAAVNGRGRYYSARDPAALRSGLSDALTGVSVRTGSAAAATSSNPNVVSGDNYIFSSTFETVKWTGELKRQTINVATGQLNSGIDWTARDQLDTNTSRSIYMFDASVPDKLKAFNWANLDGTQRAWFGSPYINNGLTQFCAAGLTCLSSASQSLAAGENLVKYLAGDRTNEGDLFDVSKFYREREHLLGDIVNAEPAYVKRPIFRFTDAGYETYKSLQTSRAGTVYAAANDGMLHAFDAETGAERWAYIPTPVMQNMHRLADKDYGAGGHRYLTDGTPMVADVYIGGAWRTILVAGLNAGGRGYYALDITVPTSPKALWEFTVAEEPNLGLSFGRPEITKLKDGTWVVLVTSGYNNSTNTGGPSGNGQGYLYVLNASTGAKIRQIPTNAGTAANPSGLTQIRAWVDNPEYNNTALRVYGGDLLGNLWRFDINGDIGAAGYDAQLIAALGRPITTRPQLGKVANFPMIFIGTGQYLGASDLTSSGTNTFYGIKDKLDTTSFGDPRNDSTFVQQTLTNGTCPLSSSICTPGQAIRTNTNNNLNLALQNGWWVNWPVSGERSFTDSDLQLGTLAVTSNIPAADACSVGGSSYINYFDYRTGGAVSTVQNVSSVSLGGLLATRPVIIGVRDGGSDGPASMVKVVVQTSTGQTLIASAPPPAGGSTARRLSWRELRTQ